MNFMLLEHPFVSERKKEGFNVVSNPATLEELAFVKSISEQELDHIILQASKAQKKWASLLALERANILLKWYELMLQYKEDLAIILTKEMGKPLNEARGEIIYGANFLRWFAEECRRIDGDIIQPVAYNQKIFVLKQPIGVCGAITPWNFPCAMITRKVAPALACGCAMIVKPASQTPLSAYAMLVLAYKAGVPNDVLQVVSGNTHMISKKLCESNLIRKLTFTGSTEIGRLLMQQSAKSIKKLSLELGGNAPFIVFNDANIQKAVEGIMLSKFRNSGQTCVCANRIYIQSGIYDELSEALKEKLQSLKLGNGIDENTTQGPLIDSQAVEKVKQHINDALSKGAKLLCGGKESELGFTFFEPTLLSGVNSQMLVAKEETFGPLAPLFCFENEDEVVQMANNTEFGLAAYLYTNDSARIFRVSEALEYGIVGVNTGIISTEVAPFGGIKQSGLGREGSKYGIDDYLELKYMCVNFTQ
ncbi:NAD-dependent succinate-semialdehyde dehydrogenase [Campylobacter sp. MIT 21-1685]|uniref:NAD-dependent succinate-semialdehyde dehydrogenase n=1 Tax=unclassified Campylobacter TaxID=2593542 RepID=UPI00224A88DC|nr:MULTISPECIES: NAD-dependent succinate-semialdehyde dehydrogenase [unclassified Campylobacter]MCX2682261.1 NAD-dependent succinate-semialdehyde dehydrogenase [Campylobacter sp. MIT 21-1684]MCX2750542.1 NAD-dependent succinate-semialdehyde dehydrogenase [Campylobacter sp. MIT 21-1682]MCX2806910.1 NAD-dependent succinate-semialdehyde dehydrogenase [Campylobacter sp. MIT 21-1685]